MNTKSDYSFLILIAVISGKQPKVVFEKHPPKVSINRDSLEEIRIWKLSSQMTIQAWESSCIDIKVNLRLAPSKGIIDLNCYTKHNRNRIPVVNR